MQTGRRRGTARQIDKQRIKQPLRHTDTQSQRYIHAGTLTHRHRETTSVICKHHRTDKWSQTQTQTQTSNLLHRDSVEGDRASLVDRARFFVRGLQKAMMMTMKIGMYTSTSLVPSRAHKSVPLQQLTSPPSYIQQSSWQ